MAIPVSLETLWVMMEVSEKGMPPIPYNYVSHYPRSFPEPKYGSGM